MTQHRLRNHPAIWLLLALLLFSITACQPATAEIPLISVSVSVDGGTEQYSIPVGSSVQTVLELANISLGQLDRVKPSVSSILTDGSEIVITRIEEEYTTTTQPIPFSSYTLPNESMPTEEQRLIQAGENGEAEVTIRITYENGKKVSQVELPAIILKKPVDEILMVGVQNPFSSISIPGRLAHLTSGNAWLMEGSSSNRRPLVTSGDLDGRVFTLSPDGRWLLYSRKSTRPAEQEINTLWVVDVEDPKPINLHVANVVHFAAWQPGTEYLIAYSTVEPRAIAPGWQANNDLYFLQFDGKKNEAGKPTQVLEASSGGIYGWWGTSYAWSPDGTRLAYTRPDSIGLVSITNEELVPLVSITPLNTYADWAWIPGITWASDGQAIYYTSHAPPVGLASPEDSPFFNLDVFSLSSEVSGSLVSQTGLFAYPSASGIQVEEGEKGFQVAYLQAIFPAQSTTSRYRLAVIDRDGSEPRQVFPPATQTGIEPQSPTWSPDAGSGHLAILSEGNLWIVDSISGIAQQLTGDGLTSRLDWK